MDIVAWFTMENLTRWQGRSIAPATLAGPTPDCHHDVHRRIVAVEPPGPPLINGPFQRAARAIAHYEVFPPTLAWGPMARPVQLGDTVGLRYRLVPGVHIFFACRVCHVFDTGQRCGFTYQTLEGHPETGEETFAVEKNEITGAVVVSLVSWSRLAIPLAGLVRPLARRLQLAAGRAALDHLERLCNQEEAASSKVKTSARRLSKVER